MSGLQHGHSLRGVRSKSRAEAIEARKSASLPVAKTIEFGAAPSDGRSAEILEAPPRPRLAVNPKAVAAVTALALAIMYLAAMLVLAASSRGHW